MSPILAQFFPGWPSVPVITDGAWGTQLQTMGLAPGECPDLWNLARPDRVEAVARSYVEAGSEVILTNTFGANRPRLALQGDEARAVEINRAGARLSRRAAGSRARVFASIGPSGALLAAGDVEPSTLAAAFAEQARALADEGVDALLLETFADLEEARIALEAAKATDLPVIVSLVFDSGADGDRTMMGVTPEEAAVALTAAGADAIGANCGSAIASAVGLCRRLRAATTLPLWIKPNAGLPDMVAGRAVYRVAPEEFARHAPALVAAGANFVGGCCGTSPAFVAALRQTLRGGAASAPKS